MRFIALSFVVLSAIAAVCAQDTTTTAGDSIPSELPAFPQCIHLCRESGNDHPCVAGDSECQCLNADYQAFIRPCVAKCSADDQKTAYGWCQRLLTDLGLDPTGTVSPYLAKSTLGAAPTGTGATNAQTTAAAASSSGLNLPNPFKSSAVSDLRSGVLSSALVVLGLFVGAVSVL